MDSRDQHTVQIKLRTYDATKVWDVIKAHDLPCVMVKHTWSYRTRADCEPHVHMWIQLNKPLGVETFNAHYIKKGLPELNGRRGEYSTTDPRGYEPCVNYMVKDALGYKKRGMEFIGRHKLSEEQSKYLDEALAAAEHPVHGPVATKEYATPAGGAGTSPPVVRKDTTLDKQIKFYKFVKEAYDADDTLEVDDETVAEFALEYFANSGVVHPSQWGPYVLYALMRLLRDRGEDDKRTSYKKSWVKKVTRSLFA